MRRGERRRKPSLEETLKYSNSYEGMETHCVLDVWPDLRSLDIQ